MKVILARLIFSEISSMVGFQADRTLGSVRPDSNLKSEDDWSINSISDICSKAPVRLFDLT